MFDIFKANKEINNTKSAQIKPSVNTNQSFLMSVMDVFTITGRGTVVVGKVEDGGIGLNEEVKISRTGRTTTVSGIEMFRKQLDYAQAGDEIGLLLRDISREEIQSGDIITK